MILPTKILGVEMDRKSGILLHITSLPSKHGIGSLGKSAFEFIDFLKASGQKLWQIFPIGPTGYGNSPYQTFSAFAGNPLFIDIDTLLQNGLLSQKEIENNIHFNSDKTDYQKVRKFKQKIFKNAFLNFSHTKDYNIFCTENSWWLDDFALFIAIKKHFNNVSWAEWDKDIKLRKNFAIEKYKSMLKTQIDYEKFLQYIFFNQFAQVKEYANKNGIQIIGDIPIFVGFDSADAWANPQIFLFDENLNPTFVAGVPPDAFSPTGQLWGNPLYNWQKLKQTDYKWWRDRFLHTLKSVDIIRLDHFLGFVNYWKIKAGEKTAENGYWEDAPGEHFFATLKKYLGNIPIIAEDLGLITPKVTKLREKFGFPGMKILQFAFYGDDSNPYLPHNITENFAVYTGTHDNETTVGWYKNLPENIRKRVNEYLHTDGKNIHQTLIKAAWDTKAKYALAPMQDFLGLDNSARMNTPGTTGGNWQWRLNKKYLTESLSYFIKEITIKAMR